MTAGTVVITGGGRGIGYAVAEQLAPGWRVVLVVRDPVRGAAAATALRAHAGPGVELVVGDLAGLARIRAAATAILDSTERIDVLVHNAGVWPTRLERTEDGLERAFATNHLAPFLLNHLLETRLLEAKARVVQVSAGLYVKGRVDLDRTPTGADFHRLRTYATTKLCNLLLLRRFAYRWAGTGVTINAVHPGVIRTGLGDPGGPLGLVVKAAKLFWQRPEVGAGPVVRLATDPALAATTGAYYHLDREQPLESDAADEALADRVWAQAARLTGSDVP